MNYRELADAALIRHLKMGDDAAFREIYSRYWRKLLVIARNKLPATENPEDLVQDLFVRLWEKRGELDADHLGAYLYTSLRHAVINNFRSRLVSEKYVLHVQQGVTAGYTTEEEVALNDLMESVERQLRELPEKTRRIFKLNRLEHKTASEISEILAIPERTVEYHISLALRQLRPLLQEFLLPTLLLVLNG